MKRPLKLTLALGVLTACFVLQSSFGGPSTDRDIGTLLNDEKSVKEVLTLLDVECRVCQRIQEPFMLLKNSSALIGVMEIYTVVYQMSIYPRETKRN